MEHAAQEHEQVKDFMKTERWPKNWFFKGIKYRLDRKRYSPAKKVKYGIGGHGCQKFFYGDNFDPSHEQVDKRRKITRCLEIEEFQKQTDNNECPLDYDNRPSPITREIYITNRRISTGNHKKYGRMV